MKLLHNANCTVTGITFSNKGHKKRFYMNFHAIYYARQENSHIRSEHLIIFY